MRVSNAEGEVSKGCEMRPRTVSVSIGTASNSATLDKRIQCQETVPRSGWAITIASNVTLVLWHRPASLGARASATA
jgi:hypothetical protein